MHQLVSDLDNSPPPLAPCEEDFLTRVDCLVDELDRAARGDDLAYHLSNVLDGVRRHCNGRQRISDRQRDALFQAINRARTAALIMLPTDVCRHRIAAGMSALSALSWFWSLPDASRAGRPRGWLADTLAHARILQNECHTASLLTEIAERASPKMQLSG